MLYLSINVVANKIVAHRYNVKCRLVVSRPRSWSRAVSRPVFGGLGLGLGLEPSGLGLGLGLEGSGLGLGLGIGGLVSTFFRDRSDI